MVVTRRTVVITMAITMAQPQVPTRPTARTALRQKRRARRASLVKIEATAQPRPGGLEVYEPTDARPRLSIFFAPFWWSGTVAQ